MGFFSNLFGGGGANLAYPQPHRVAPKNLGDAIDELKRLSGCFDNIAEEAGWFDVELINPFFDAYNQVITMTQISTSRRIERVYPLCPGGDPCSVLSVQGKLLFVAFSPFYDANERFYRPFGMFSQFQSLDGDFSIVKPDMMKYLVYCNPYGESVLVNYANRLWIDGRVHRVYNLR